MKYENPVLKENNHVITWDYMTRNSENPSHTGVDLVSKHKGYNCTDYIIAIADGEVTISTNSSTAGQYIELEHENGARTRYLHLKDGTRTLKVGDKVKKGDILGYMGNTGYSFGAHLHFDIKLNGAWQDPIPYLKGEKDFTVTEPIPTPSNEYKVVAGDTLSEIAVKYNTTIEELMELNPEIEDANKIYVGQVIEVPSDEIVYYTVKSGDTLSGIANAYNTTWEKIYEDNKKVIGDNPNLIQPGQKLIIK